MSARVFIDGEAGTTGLSIYERLERRGDLELLRIDPERRKDPSERKRLLNLADVAILCLPDEAAQEAVSWVERPGVKILDASTAHRTAPGWTYGLPELKAEQRQRIQRSTRVANPGCYPTGAIALLRPLIDAGALSAAAPLSVHAVSGYSGGGRKLIERFQSANAPKYGAYGFGLTHKHLPEMQRYARLESTPLFSPAVGNFECGMLVFVPLGPSERGAATGADLQRLLSARYAAEPFISVRPLNDESALDAGYLDPEALNGTNRMQLFVYSNEQSRQTLLVARLDNLGKGAAGAALQNLNLMLGIEETRGLS